MLTNDSILDFLYIDVPKRDSSVFYEKITDSTFTIPSETEYHFLVCKNYRVAQLKRICREYHIKVSGNKELLRKRIYNFLRLSVSARKVQQIMKLNYIKIYNKNHGPARLKRDICVNDTDFYLMDKLSEIPYDNFYSFCDTDNKIYGFNILSLYKIFSKSNAVKNPYNRKELPLFIVQELKCLIKKNKFYKKFANGGNDIVIEQESQDPLSEKQQIELRTLDVFQKMDMLGNYTNTNWFLSLDRPNIIRFIRSLADIWHHRAELTQQKQREICPPYGDPFRLINLYGLTVITTSTLQRMSLSLIEKMVSTGIDQDSKYLGSSYVLCALTLVNENAAESLPWLYQSVIEYPNS